jgi:hypothetical protein
MPMSAPKPRKSAPLRHELEAPSVFGMELHPDAVALSKDSAALCDAYGGNGGLTSRGLATIQQNPVQFNPILSICAVAVAPHI